MTRDRSGRDEPPGSFPPPPTSFVDAEGRDVDVCVYGDGPVADEFDALLAMYADFDPSDRAQGIPPSHEPELREWLEGLVGGDAINVLAWHRTAVAGHATLVPDGEGGCELAIFVHQSYQRAGIGGRLIRCLLGEGARRGVGRVWLTVERWNEAAVALYRQVGFRTTSAESFELEMERRLN